MRANNKTLIAVFFCRAINAAVLSFIFSLKATALTCPGPSDFTMATSTSWFSGSSYLDLKNHSSFLYMQLGNTKSISSDTLLLVTFVGFGPREFPVEKNTYNDPNGGNYYTYDENYYKNRGAVYCEYYAAEDTNLILPLGHVATDDDHYLNTDVYNNIVQTWKSQQYSMKFYSYYGWFYRYKFYNQAKGDSFDGAVPFFYSCLTTAGAADKCSVRLLNLNYEADSSPYHRGILHFSGTTEI